MKQKLTKRKKILIVASLAVIFVAALAVSLALILAASTQNMTTNISIAYVVDGVGARVSASYAIVPLDESEATELVTMKTTDNKDYIDFIVLNEETSAQLAPTGELVLSPQRQKMVFEYKFENTADTSFTVELTDIPSGNNITEKYFVSGVRLQPSQYINLITQTTFTPQALVEYGSTAYVYVLVEVENENRAANYEGQYKWHLSNEEATNMVYLDNGTESTGGRTEINMIPTTALANGVAMPVINSIPTHNDSDFKFKGYFTQLEGAGVKYINEYGSSVHIADLADGTTLYAYFEEIPFIIEGSTLMSVSNIIKSQETIEVPSNVTTIGANALSGAAAKSVVVSNNVETIGDSAFENMTNLETVTFDDTDSLEYASSSSKLKTIGANAFSGCSKLANIDLPSSVTSIGERAFSSCSSLTSIEIPSSVTSIGNYVFQNCTNITKLEYPCVISLNSLFDYYFDVPSSLSELVINGGELNSELSVLSFGNSYIKRLTIAPSVTTISDESLKNFEKLEYLELPYVLSSSQNVNSLFTGSTYDGSGSLANLNEVVFNGGTSLPSNAVSYVGTLKKVTVGSTFTSINYGFVNLCYSCEELIVDKNNPVYNDGNGSNCIIETATNTLIRGCNTTIIPNTVTSIGNGAFAYSGIKSLTIPDSVTKLGTDLFNDAWNLETVVIGNGITSIPSYMFYDRYNLKNVTIGQNVTSIGDYAFSACSSLITINYQGSRLGWSRISIGVYNDILSSATIIYAILGDLDSTGMFYFDGTILVGITDAAKSATELVIPVTTTSFAYGILAECTSLQKLTLPSIFSFGQSLENCSGLSSLFYSGFNENIIAEDYNSYIPSSLTEIVLNGGTEIKYCAFQRCSNITKITIDCNTITAIDGYAFYGCSLTSITIPSSVTSIGQYAFDGCDSLVYNEYDNAYYLGNSANPYHALIKAKNTSITSCTINANTKVIANHAFSSCSKLTSITIPASVTSIGGSAFYYCSKLTSVTIPSSVTSIGEYAFDGCSSLNYYEYDNAYYLGNSANPYHALIKAKNTSITSCTINANTKVIANPAFSSCSKLTSITIPASVTSIGDQVFFGCSSLTSIEIPSSVTSIGDYAFYSCYSLVQVRNLSGQTMSGYTAPSYAEVLTNNTAFKSVVEIGSKYATFIPANSSEKILLCAFDKTITTATDLPSDLTQINQYAFYNCTSLTSITLPSSITNIGNYAFYECSKLTSVTIPSSVTSIGDSAFRYCSSLTSIEIPSSVTSIGSSAFANCSKLTSVTFKNTTGWAAYDGASKKYDLTVTNATTNATNLKNTSSSGTTGWGRYTLKRT